jgi:hypothetical protein
MRLKGYLKGFFIFGLILFLGVTLFAPASTVAYANETQEIKLNVNSQTIVRGKTFSLYVYNLKEGQTVTYRSSSPAIASVDKDGVIYANLIGTSTIVVTVKEGDSVVAILSCKVTIGPPAISVQFSRLELAMTVGQNYLLERIVQPLITVEIPKFSSYNKKIASVSAGGRVSALTEGETYIFAQIDNGAFAACKVTVFPEGTELPKTPTSDVTDLLVLLGLLPPAEEPATVENAEPDPLSEGEEKVVETIEGTDKEPASNRIFIDFETFIKNLNAAGKTANEAESTTDNAD